MPTFVVPDAHGNHQLVRGLLIQERLIDENGRRFDNSTHVVQLGDLCNCVAPTIHDDLACLQFAQEWFDVMLIGNHEYAYFGGDFPFDGFWPDPEIKMRLHQLNAREFIKAAHAVDDILITHAGLTPWAMKRLAAPDLSPAGIAFSLNSIWKMDPRDPIFAVEGMARGGRQKEGGVLWADWSEPKLRKIRQLIGHSVDDRIRYKNSATCIDLGAGKGSTRMAGAWIRDGIIETVIHTKEAVRA